MPKKKTCDACKVGGSSPLSGPGLTRRHLFRIAGTGLVATTFADVLTPFPRASAAAAPPLLGTARNAVLFFLAGGASHSDMWDLKEGAWTPAALRPTSYGDVRFPQGLLPKTAEQMGSLAFVRALKSWAAVHGLAQSWAQIARNPAGVLGNVAPHVGSVVSLEMQSRRNAGDVLPSFVGLNSGSMLGSGYLPARYGPFVVSRASSNGLSALKHPEGAVRFADRWGLLAAMDPDRAPDSALGKPAADMNDFYGSAKTLIDTPSVNTLFSYTAADYARYGSTSSGGAAILAKQLLAANQGCRFVQITIGGWDNHSNIYGTTGNGGLFTASAQLDGALGGLLGDLKAAPGVAGGKSLLDETIVMVFGEFGRTVGALNNQGGRDHFLQTAALVAGGGVVGGRVIGTTDATASKSVEFGWRANRDARPEDLACTLYSALGIDYTTTRYDDPIGRGFEYVPFAKQGVYEPLTELF